MKSIAMGLLLCVLLLGTTGALAERPGTVFLEELTWTEIRDRIQGGATTVLIPIGGTEQNGPHMAVGKHNVRVKALSEKIARALGNALVAPVLAYVPEGELSPPTGHMRLPGTLTVPDDVFQKTVEYAARSLKAHGFRHVVLLGDHGSTQAGQGAVAARLNREWVSTPVRVHAVSEYYRASQEEFRQLLKARGYRDEEIGRHASLADTSLMLAVDPGLVRMDRLRRGTGPTGDGVDGDPSRASAELGRLGVDAIVARTVSAVKAAIARP
jgi:creatinine amidohydrolase